MIFYVFKRIHFLIHSTRVYMRAYDRQRKTKITHTHRFICSIHCLFIYFFCRCCPCGSSQHSYGRKYIWWLFILWFHNILFTYSHFTYFSMFVFRDLLHYGYMQHMMLVELLLFYAENVLFETRDLMHLKACQQVSQCSVSSAEIHRKSNTINGVWDRRKTKTESFWFRQLNPNELYPFTHSEFAHLTYIIIKLTNVFTGIRNSCYHNCHYQATSFVFVFTASPLSLPLTGKDVTTVRTSVREILY